MAKSKQVGRGPTNKVARTPKLSPRGAASIPAPEPELADALAALGEGMAKAKAAAEAEPAPQPEPEPEVATTPEPEPQPEPEAQPDHPAELMAALRASLDKPEGGKTVEYGKDGYVGTKPTPKPEPERQPRQPRAPGEPRPVKVAVSEGRMAELVEEARAAVVMKPTEEAAVYARILAETGLKPAGLARAICPEPRAEMGKLWDRIIWRGCLLDLSPEIQAMVDAGEINAGHEVGQLAQVPEARRGELVAAIKAGFKSRGAMYAFAAELKDKAAA